MGFYYLLDAKTEGRIVILRFYHAQKDQTLEIRDLDYKSYFFLPHPHCSKVMKKESEASTEKLKL